MQADENSDTGGDDACFVSKSGLAIGVADGVGSWVYAMHRFPRAFPPPSSPTLSIPPCLFSTPSSLLSPATGPEFLLKHSRLPCISPGRVRRGPEPVFSSSNGFLRGGGGQDS